MGDRAATAVDIRPVIEGDLDARQELARQ